MNVKKLLAASAAAALVALQAGAASALDITSNHMDLDIDYAAGILSMDWRTYSPMSAGTPANNDDYAIAGNAVVVPVTNTFVVPGSASFSCLGAGTTTYRLQSANTNTSQVWLGWNIEDIADGIFTNNRIQLKLKSVPTKPNVNARFALYTTNSFGTTATILLNSSTAVGCPKSSMNINKTFPHGHGFWSFTHPGTYVVRFEATGTLSGGGTVSTGDIDVTFKVQ